VIDWPILAVLVLVAFIWLAALHRWRLAIYGLFGYVPLAGAVQLWLPEHAMAVLAKDILFVAPAYLGFLLNRGGSRPALVLPAWLRVFLVLFAAIVLLQCVNPAAPSWLATLVGVKVWLFYVPLLFLGFSMARRKSELESLLKFLIVLQWVPCLAGAAQWLGSVWFDYRTTMRLFYGDAAAAATQGFASFDLGGKLLRFPSTFSFPMQYYSYLLSATAVTYAGLCLFRSRLWSRISGISLGLVVLASFLSGVRAAFVFTPLLLGVIYLLHGRPVALVKVMVILAVIVGWTLNLSQVNAELAFQHLVGLTQYYARVNTWSYVASYTTFLGAGTGAGTGAARYVLKQADRTVPESYYAKAGFELGVIGLAAVAGLLAAIVGTGLAAHRRVRDDRLRAVSAAALGLVITVCLYCFKGSFLDFDPLNVLFWFLVGLMLKVPRLDARGFEPSLAPERRSRWLRAAWREVRGAGNAWAGG